MKRNDEREALEREIDTFLFGILTLSILLFACLFQYLMIL